MKRILITGGAGYIGTVLVETLLSNINRLDIEYITVYDNLMYKQDGLFPLLTHPKLRFVYGDVRDFDKLKEEVNKHNIIIPLAAIVGFPACERDKALAEHVNCDHIRFIVDSVAHDTKIIYPNTNSGYGVSDGVSFCDESTPLSPISTYGITKCKAEKAVRESGGISLRLATVFGTSYRFRKDLLVNDFVLRAVTDGFIVLFESHFKRNFIHIRDVVNAFILMIERYNLYRGQAFNVGLSSANLSKLELCEAIKKRVSFVIKTDEFSKDADKRNYIVSNDKLEATGWFPRYSLDDGIQELIKAYKVFTHANTKHTNL
jgi:nucleoside-diphosphate-sugar epimerase